MQQSWKEFETKFPMVYKVLKLDYIVLSSLIFFQAIKISILKHFTMNVCYFVMLTIILKNYFFQTDCSFWPPAQFVNFMFVPPALRVVYVNVFTIAWNVFLSYAKYFVSSCAIRLLIVQSEKILYFFNLTRNVV